MPSKIALFQTLMPYCKDTLPTIRMNNPIEKGQARRSPLRPQNPRALIQKRVSRYLLRRASASSGVISGSGSTTSGGGGSMTSPFSSSIATIGGFLSGDLSADDAAFFFAGDADFAAERAMAR